MALTLGEIYTEIQDRFHLSWLAAKGHTGHVLSWVHMIEDPAVSNFFWGNELLVTSGFSAHTAADMIALIDTLDQNNASGLVVNVGKYVAEIPPEVIRHCDEIDFPLLSMPWEMHMNEFVRVCCSRIGQSSYEVAQLSKAVISAIQSPNEKGDYYARLTDYFDEQAGYQILDVYVDVSEQIRRRGFHVAELRFHTALNYWGFQYLVFPFEQRFLLVLNQTDPAVTDQIAQKLVETYHTTYEDRTMRISVGIGEPVSSVTQLSAAYLSACAAVRRAQLTHADIIRFRDMGFYKLLYSIPDSDMMLHYYHEVMGPLLEHDEKHGSNYEETLFRYLLHDGSLQAVAEEMFTHRNTVNYRMGRIRELLDCPLNTHTECLPYLLAYHIAVMLRVIERYE